MTETLNIPACQPFGEQLAGHIIDGCRDRLPDLTAVHIIIPNALAIAQLRHQLIRHQPSGMIGPQLGSLQHWLRQQLPDADETRPTINQQARRLIMIDALNRHPQLFGDVSSWQICDSLLDLFDQLLLQQPDLLDCSEADWIARLQQAYGDNSALQPLHHEARIVYTLWQAWHQQLQEMNLIDANRDYLQRLQQTLDSCREQTLFVLGRAQFSPLELHWCEQLARHNRVIEVVQDCSTEHSFPLHPVFDLQRPLQQRIEQLQNSGPPTGSRIRSFDAGSIEQQAQAISAQAAYWQQQGRAQIAIITEDRKLARRVRALLERRQILVQDTAGWSLSTTSAASCIERWLQCIEQDFAYQPLLDLLKSPFFIDEAHRESHLNQVYRLEQDIILHENIPGDLHRYRKALWQRQKRLGHWSSGTVKQLSELLDRLQQQAAPLVQLHTARQLLPASDFLHAINHSLQQLGIHQRLVDDQAGARILAELDAMQHSLEVANPQLNWQEFRTWLASALEQAQFTPQDAPSAVHLMNMQQAEYCRFDALIIAGANRSSLPGDVAQTAFFNQRVKQALGLKNWQQQRDETFSLFKRLLVAADQVLITYSSEQDGEWLQPSPWITSLLDAWQLAFGESLQDRELEDYFHYLAQQQAAQIGTFADAPTRTRLRPELVPDSYSASRYQRLVNCPYRFFAADGLSLKPEETISQELMKSDYGEKVHFILFAFHSPCPGLPDPFPAPVNELNREQALQHMIELSRQVFARDIEDTVQHRGWLNRWLDTAPAYIDWLLEHNRDWQIHQLEQELEVNLDTQSRLKGRLDRIDRQQDHYAVIDYKTGGTASQADVDKGEDVQLVSYAKLLDGVSRVAYLKLDRGEVKAAAQLEDAQLEQIRELSLQRLQGLIADIRNGHELTAWGDTETCRHCDMAGLCRKQIWENA